MKSVVFVCSVILALLSTPLSAQLNELTDESSFSDTRLRLDFEAYPEGLEASNSLAAWGIRFSTRPQNQLRIGFWTGPPSSNIIAPSPVPIPVLRNTGVPPLGSPNAPLTIDFAEPVRRVGLILHPGTSGIESARQDPFPIRISAFNSEGSSLGEIQRESFGELETTLFLGIEPEAGKFMSKVVLDYGNALNPEEIEAILVDFQRVPRFVSCLPQIADGSLATGSLRFSVSITNLGRGVATGTLSLKDPSGEDLALELNGTRGSIFPFELKAYETRRLSSLGALPEAVRGYALVESNGPVLVSEVFQALDADGKVVHEAGIDAQPPKAVVFAPASRRLDGRLDTGVAVANLSDSTVIVVADLVEGGPDGFYHEASHQLERGEQMAVFLDQLLNLPEQTLPPDLDATLFLRSTGEISVTVLRTVQGVVSASLPVGTPLEGR